ncbi:MAG TPA: hypothetical protein VFJ90_15875 [Candidatus Didemnitutus sp.]|nr:hypothetical protein [Candidatus Didemnitutus sp.]
MKVIPVSLRKALLTLSLAVGFVAVPLSAAANDVSLQARADKAAALPVMTAFTKAAEKGPYHLTITNTSKAALKLSVTVAQSVQSHASAKTHTTTLTIEAGKAGTVEELAAHDKVTLSAEGFEKLEVTVQ